MAKNREKEISKQLSYVLRHKPDSIGLKLDTFGWVDIELLLQKMLITREELEYVVENNLKKRFAISDDNKRIRANQGHSIHIELGLTEKLPPTILYHGTAIRNLDKIEKEGLLKMNRNHVHLSSDIPTAKQVGSRHGKPIVLLINCEEMVDNDVKFYQADNGVWLTTHVEARFIKKLND